MNYFSISVIEREWPVEKMKDIKLADALKHPIWSLGRKITIDSATLFNKVCVLLLPSFLDENCFLLDLSDNISHSYKINFFCVLAGSRSNWSTLFVWSRIWRYWDCNSSTIYHTFNDWNTGLTPTIYCVGCCLLL